MEAGSFPILKTVRKSLSKHLIGYTKQDCWHVYEDMPSQGDLLNHPLIEGDRIIRIIN